MAWIALALASTALASPTAAEGAVSLWIAVPRPAGSVYDVAADGAAGQCSVVDQVIHCPATGPVTFRWGPGGDWTLSGDTTLAPGGVGTAAVWAPEGSQAEARARLQPDRVGPDDVADVFVRTGDHPVQVPTEAAFQDLLALAGHRDPKVRRQVVDALVPYWRHTASDPIPAGAPPLVPLTLVVALAQDDDVRVRRRTAFWLRDLRDPELSGQVTALLVGMAGRGSVQRVAFASLASRARDGRGPAEEAWHAAMERVAMPGPPGRAAANTLGALSASLTPGHGVDPVEAVHRVAEHHVERTWVVWRRWAAAVPFEPALAERLLRETLGLSPPLVRAWADDDPEGLVGVLRHWEPARPHSDRYRMVARALANCEAPAVRAVLDDNLSGDGEAPPAQ
ncbi:MAG: hypothetical protein R3F59_11690 [Myxococcota bacterium]